ncbi:alpha/beta hydrolase [Aeromicrobium sp. Sec7.5]|uniref:alpha/beta hydrolase n=1 Tax=Aeromicrobium sp. Sec7.5 TaxID=3121276 RepID=UPI002FE45F1C
MTIEDYARFLPDDVRARVEVEPEEDWWSWRGRRVHLARARRPDAALRVWVLHGAGGHSGLVWPLASIVASEGMDLMVPDLPLYGRTVEPDPSGVRYGDWLDLLEDLVEAEDDDRPLIVLGASMGGMLAYELAARTGRVSAVAATCLLDLSDPHAREAATRWRWMGKLAPLTLPLLGRLFARVRVPITWFADMGSMSRDPELARLCASDPLGGGGRVPIGWLASYFAYEHTPPESFTACPVLLVHPANDGWTPPALSQRFVDRIAVPVETVLLEGCGHFPVEQPGLDQAEAALRELAERTLVDLH